jgi:hypothetical protein
MDETQQVPNQNPITSVPQPTTYPTPQPAPTSKTTWIFIAVIVVLIGVASYFGYQNYQLKQPLTTQQPSPTPATTIVDSPTSTSTPTYTPDPISNWKTYTDTKNDYSIKYPSNFKIENKDEDVNINDFTEADPNCKGGGCFLGTYSLKLSIKSVVSNQTNLKSIVDEKYNQDLNFYADVTPLKLSTLNNYLAYYFEATGAERYSNYYLMSNSGTILKISYANNGSKYLTQILSTFKFTK